LELIAQLSEDVGQILLAGAAMAASSTELARDRDALGKLARQLGDKARAIGKLAEAAARATSTREILNLAQMTRMVRAAQAQPARPGSTQPLARHVPIGSPCDRKNVETIYAYLALKRDRQEGWTALENAAESGHLSDVRLVEALMLAANDEFIGHEVRDRILPGLGRVVVQPIRQRLDVQRGDRLHAAWLRALVAVEEGAAHDVLRAALLRGSPAMREAALMSVAQLYPGDARLVPDVLKAVGKDRRWELRDVTVGALTGATSAAAVEALLEIFDSKSGRELAVAISEALIRSGRKHAARIAAHLVKIKDPSLAKHLLRVLVTLGVPKDRRLKLKLERLAGHLHSEDQDLIAAAVEAAFSLGEKHSLAALAPVFDRSDDPLAEWRFAEVAESLERHPRYATEAWRKLLLSVVERDPSLLRRLARVFGELRERRALPLLMAAARRNDDEELRWNSIAALGKIGDPRAFDVIVDRAGKQIGDWEIVGRALRNLPGAARRLKKLKQTRRIRALQELMKSSGNDDW
jgi:HEAT repeat protein